MATIRNTSYADPVAQHWARIAGSDLYNNISVDNYEDYNGKFGDYYGLYRDAMSNGNYYYGGNQAYDGGQPVQNYQQWWHSIGGHGNSVWNWGTGHGGTTDIIKDGKFAGDTYFGDQTYRRAMNFFTNDEVTNINNGLKARGLEFVLDPRARGLSTTDGREYYKLQRIPTGPGNEGPGNNQDDGSEGPVNEGPGQGPGNGPGQGPGAGPGQGPQGPYGPGYPRSSQGPYSPNTGKNNSPWSDWLVHAMSALNGGATFAAMRDLGAQKTASLQSWAPQYYQDSSNYATQQKIQAQSDEVMDIAANQARNAATQDQASAIMGQAHEVSHSAGSAINDVLAQTFQRDQQGETAVRNNNMAQAVNASNNNLKTADAIRDYMINNWMNFLAKRYQQREQTAADIYRSATAKAEMDRINDRIDEQTRFKLWLAQEGQNMQKYQDEWLDDDKTYETYGQFNKWLNGFDKDGENWIGDLAEDLGLDASALEEYVEEDEDGYPYLNETGMAAVWAAAKAKKYKSAYEREYKNRNKWLTGKYYDLQMQQALAQAASMKLVSNQLGLNIQAQPWVLRKEGGKVYKSQYEKFHNYAETLRKNQADVAKVHQNATKMGKDMLKVDLKHISDEELLLLRSIFK